MSTMNFFEHQDRARRATRWLYFYYVLAVLFVIVALNVGLLGLLIIIPQMYCSDSHVDYSYLTPENVCYIVSGITSISSLIVFSGAGIRSFQLRSLNGGQVAESLGGRLVASNTKNPQERQLLNIVEEMSIASGVPVPKVYILDNEKSINAFASGWNTDEAAIAVTRGSLDYFTRDELQGVIGHEFSHILNGDMTVDMRMVGLLFGLELIFLVGYFILRVMMELSNSERRSSKDDNNSGGGLGVIALVGLTIMVIGYVGKVTANIIRMAVSRQKEYLADASSVQFTRNPEGIGYALMKIRQINLHNPITNPNASSCGHFFFASIDGSIWDSHPPLKKRIARILPNFDGRTPECVLRDLQDPPGLRYLDDDEKKKKKNPLEEVLQRFPEQMRHTHIPGLGGGILGGLGVGSAVQSPDESESLDDLIHDVYSVHGVIYALLMDSSPEIQNLQWNVLRSNQNEYMLKLVERLVPRLNSLTCADKVRLTELSVTALRQMSSNQYQTFRANIVALTEADKKLDLFEFGLRMILTGRLDVDFGLRKESNRFNISVQYSIEFRMALGYLAWQGADNEQDARGAFEMASSVDGLNVSFPRKEECTLTAFASSLKAIQSASAAVRELFFNAFLMCINYDGKITPKEEDLVNVIGACLNLSCDVRSSNNQNTDNP